MTQELLAALLSSRSPTRSVAMRGRRAYLAERLAARAVVTTDDGGGAAKSPRRTL